MLETTLPPTVTDALAARCTTTRMDLPLRSEKGEFKHRTGQKIKNAGAAG